MEDCAAITTANDCLRVAAIAMADWPAIVAPLEPMMVVFTVITPKSSIRIWISGTRTALMAIVLASTAVALAIATRKADALTPDCDAAVAAPTA